MTSVQDPEPTSSGRGGSSDPLKLSSDIHMNTPAHVCLYAHTQIISKYKFSKLEVLLRNLVAKFASITA